MKTAPPVLPVLIVSSHPISVLQILGSNDLVVQCYGLMSNFDALEL